jgi:hypothetical protein
MLPTERIEHPTFGQILKVKPLRSMFWKLGNAEKVWCRQRGLNSRPSVYKTAALPLCYAGDRASCAISLGGWQRESEVFGVVLCSVGRIWII